MLEAVLGSLSHFERSFNLCQHFIRGQRRYSGQIKSLNRTKVAANRSLLSINRPTKASIRTTACWGCGCENSITFRDFSGGFMMESLCVKLGRMPVRGTIWRVSAAILCLPKLLVKKRGPTRQAETAMLRFAAAAEIIETDFWVQYNELGGIPDNEVPGGSGNPAYTAAVAMLDSDMAQYIHDNTDDENTHQSFLNAYLASRGAETVSLEPFRTLEGSKATGSSGKLRITNLMELTLDTSWWTRYRSAHIGIWN